MKYLCILSFFVLSIPSLSQAKVQANSYVEFETPDSWNCQSVGPNLKCEIFYSKNAAAGTLETAFENAELNVEDSLKKLESRFSMPKNFTLPAGEILRSKPIFSRKVEVAGKPWIDTLHHAGSVPGSYTRYLATTEFDITTIVTITVEKDKYALVLPQIELVIQSLRPFRGEIVCYGAGEDGSALLMDLSLNRTPDFFSLSENRKLFALIIGVSGLALSGFLALRLRRRRL